MPVQNLLLGSKCSEHYFVRAYGLFRRERGTWSAKDPVLGERPALNTAERCRRWYFVVGAYFDINMRCKREEERERETCRFHGRGRGCGRRGSGGRRRRMGFEEEIGGRSRSRDWRREREGEARERMNGGVVAGGD
ncbi:hypothetical protein TIFTF001_027171 [Ficus carica]|uniref:Uncharacterized protein n=1 Tax=Ficus carica TaxID=3494 RepID=A0AA88DMI4_FICCA|nr:hypothetical protein TIFTF001_027171 [Ficus carica]